MNEFERLTISEDGFGEWTIDRENDGTPEHPIQMPFVSYSEVVYSFIQDIYEFEKMHPEMKLTQYEEILSRYNISWGSDSMSSADVTALDGQCVMALIMAAVRAERFCDGALLGFFGKGSIKRWLERLHEIDG